MLQSIREKVTGWVAGVILLAVGVGLALFGVDFQAATGNYAARVNGERIPVETVRRAWQNRQAQLHQMMGGEVPEVLLAAQRQALLEEFIRTELLSQRAEKFGYRVSDRQLADRLREIPELQVDGQFSRDRYAALLRAQGLTEPQFEADLRGDMMIRQVQLGIVDSSFVTPHELDRRQALQAQQREIDYALIPAADFAAGIEVTDEQIEAWYREHSDEFMLPEKVDLEYIELTRARAEQSVTVTEEALREHFENVKDRFERPESRRARHILIPVEEGDDKAAARKTAEELAERARAGEDFAQLAREHSKDPGSAQQGGDLGWAQRGMFVGPFEEALFAMSPGEIRGPVETPFGFHVIRLEEIQAGEQQTFEEARPELEAEYRRERSQTIFYDQTQRMADLAFTALTELESVARELDLPLQKVSDFTREGGEPFGDDRQIIEAAFSEDVLERGENSPLIALGDDRAVILRVARHTPAEPRPLAEVRDEIAARIRTQAAREAAAERGRQALAKLRENKADWESVTKEMGLANVGARLVTRNDSIVPPAVLRAAFSVPRTRISGESPAFDGVSTDDGNFAVFAVSDVQDGDPAAQPEEARNGMRRLAERQVGNEEFVAYLVEAERQAKIVRTNIAFE